jgi:hypothetical protein
VFEEGNTLERPLDPNTVDHNEDTEVTINSDLIDGDYIVTIRARDAALNQDEVIIENFTIDATPPEFSSVVIDPSNPIENPNSHMIVTFDDSEILYSLPTAEGELTNDGIITLLDSDNNVVTFLGVNGIEHPYDDSPNKFRLSISLLNDYIPDGTEVITVTVDINTIYDRAGNAVINPDQAAISNDVTLIDQTPPKLVRADGSHPEYKLSFSS